MDLLFPVEFRVPLIGSESLRCPSIQVLDRHDRQRFIPNRDYANRKILDGVKRDWEGTQFAGQITETVFDIASCEYGYTVSRTDYLPGGQVTIFVRLWTKKSVAIKCYMDMSHSTYDGK